MKKTIIIVVVLVIVIGAAIGVYVYSKKKKDAENKKLSEENPTPEVVEKKDALSNAGAALNNMGIKLFNKGKQKNTNANGPETPSALRNRAAADAGKTLQKIGIKLPGR